MRPRYVKVTKIYMENSKYRQTGTGRGCAGTENPEGTPNLDNLLSGIWNQIPQDPDNTFKGIRYLGQNGTQSQWPIELTIPT